MKIKNSIPVIYRRFHHQHIPCIYIYNANVHREVVPFIGDAVYKYIEFNLVTERKSVIIIGRVVRTYAPVSLTNYKLVIYESMQANFY